MPAYDYKCEACEKVTEIRHSIKDKPKKKCPSCGKNKLKVLISGGGGVIFKGDGWYSTSSVAYINDKARDNPTGKVGIGD